VVTSFMKSTTYFPFTLNSETMQDGGPVELNNAVAARKLWAVRAGIPKARSSPSSPMANGSHSSMMNTDVEQFSGGVAKADCRPKEGALS